jgi:hypothetical protein
MQFLDAMFSSGPFMPHGYCYMWVPGLVWLHVISDSLITLAYLSIPFTLAYFVRRRTDLPFNWMFLCFGVFILACGTTHAMEVWNLWHADYWVAGAIKAITAIASLATAVLLVKLVPHAVELPSPAALRSEIAERTRAEEALKLAKSELELRVEERTAELKKVNEDLVLQIDRRQTVEQHLRDSEEQLRLAQEASGVTEAPLIVHEVLHGAGQPLDGGTRAWMEPRFGRDLSGVRVHTGAQADESARAVGARAYAVGQDAVFAAGQYNPGSREGLRLLAHELSHTVQQVGGAAGLSSAAPAVAREPTPQDAPKKDDPKNKPAPVTVTAPAEELLNPSGPIAPVKGSGQTSGGGAGQTPGAVPGVPAPQQYTPSQPPVVPPGYTPLPPLPSQAGGSAAGSGAAAPSRLSLHDFGRLSLGLRLGFPELEKNQDPNATPSALQESIKKGEILNFQLTGQLPSEYKLDPGKLVGAAWGIFSQRIAPDIAAKIAAGMSSKPQGSGVSFQLDTVLIIHSSATKKGGGGGVSLTLTF